MANLFSRFAKLTQQEPLLIGAVTAHNSDGTSTVTLPGGGVIRVRGIDVAVGQNAFIKAGEISGQAPNLPSYVLDV